MGKLVHGARAVVHLELIEQMVVSLAYSQCNRVGPCLAGLQPCEGGVGAEQRVVRRMQRQGVESEVASAQQLGEYIVVARVQRNAEIGECHLQRVHGKLSACHAAL